jgi:folylpolyglutamate synthase/dihydropteroate synthase
MTAKKDLKETLAPLVSQLQSNSLFSGLVLTEPISGRNPAVQINSLEKTLRKLGVVPDSAYENPVEAFEIASEMAVEGNYDLIVLGSVYLVGDLFRHMVESNDWDLWESLSSH